MKVGQFQQVNGEWLKSILNDPKGQALLAALSSMQPPFPTSESVHIFAKEAGKREGFEQCLKSLIALCNVRDVRKEPEANYGVPDKTETTT